MEIWKLFNETLGPLLDYDKMTIAISRPHNLRDILTKTPLTIPDHLNMKDIITHLTSSKSLENQATQEILAAYETTNP